MAILGKIRQRTGLLLFVVATALVIFIVQAALENGFFGSNANNIGTVNGTDIPAMEFMQKVSQAEKQGQNTSNTQAMNMVWEQQLRTIIVGEEAEKLGLGIAADQLINVIKENPFFSQNPQFLNAAGSFDENKFREFVKSIKNDPDQTRWREWQNFEIEAEKAATQDLYYNLVKGSVYTTKAEGKFKHMTENKKVTFDYVMVPYASVNDEEVKISDDEIIAFMKKSPKKYKSDNTRSIEYILIEEKPSADDERAIAKALDEVLNGKVVFNNQTNKNDTLPAFKNAKNVSDFVNKNSDIKFDSTYVVKSQLPVEYQEQLFNLSTGEVFGPYIYNGHQCVSRLVDKKGNGSVKASHILLAYEGAARSTATRTKEEAQKLANELLAKAKANPATFATLADENTDDGGSKGKGGEYDNIMPNQMVEKFNDFIFNNPVGSIGVVETEFGFHVIKVSDKYPSVLLATVARKIEPSSATSDALFTKAAKLEQEAASKKLEDIAKAQELSVVPASNLKASDEFIAGLGTNREIVRWSFSSDSKVGTVKRFETAQGFVIAKVTNINETGLLPIDVARDNVGYLIRNEKKAEIIKKKMKTASLEEAATSSGSSVLLAQDVALGTSIVPNVGQEPKVIGTAFNLGAGKTSKTIDGNTGVFIIRTKAVTEAPKIELFTSYINQEQQNQQNAAQMRAYEALKNKAKIEDNRFNF